MPDPLDAHDLVNGESGRPGPRGLNAAAGREGAGHGRTAAAGEVSPESSVLHQLLVETVRDYAIFALDPSGHVLTWNAGARRFKGWTAEEAIGLHFSTFYTPEDVAAGKPDADLREAAGRGSFEDEGWRVRRNGERFWASIVISALRDENGELVGFAKVTRDLTERRQQEERLRVTEERFRLLVQSVRDYAIFMLDPLGHVMTWNDGAQRIKGYAADEIVGRHFSVFYPPEARAAKFPERVLATAATTGRFEDEGWRVRRDGSLIWASVVITALRDDAGELVGFAKVTRDLTERREAEQRALEDARRVAEMEAANRAKSEFLATLSHELRTPLNAIGGYTDLLALEVAGRVNEQQRQYLDRVRTSQLHLLALVNDLLNLARLEAGRIEFDIRRVELHALLDDVEGMIQPELQADGVRLLRQDCAPGVAALCDRARAQQILLNLLSNAVKFTPAGETVILECTSSGDTIRISVRDAGPGIPEDKQEAIFEPFVQLGRSLTETREGIGLGLAISRRLARGMDGDLTVASRPGEGSTFVVTLAAG
ncbi:MAG TPA: PAS domain S-box protein [Longimicrobiales bacterium]|nr:PAS domain S-box protein [Longimicrobiales bacterium]